MFVWRAMDTDFEEFVKAGFVVVYVDGISIVSDTEKKHFEHLDRVLRLIAESGIKLRMDKRVFATERINYLGFNIDGGVSRRQRGTRTRF